jgi:predicted metalloprotease with PDZ domain
MDVWNSGTSGIGRNNASTVSYYVKGPVVGFLLDARIQVATGGKKRLDDVMRLAYRRYSGARGFTAEEFRRVAEEAAGADLKEWFKRAVSSTEELDYTEALEWFGLQFAAGGGERNAKSWRLEVRSEATESQRAHLQRLTGREIRDSTRHASWRSAAQCGSCATVVGIDSRKKSALPRRLGRAKEASSKGSNSG